MKLRQIELWGATLVVIIAVALTLSWMGNYEQRVLLYDQRNNFNNNNIPFSYALNYFVPTMLPCILFYAGFLVLIFLLFPKLFDTKRFNAFVWGLLGLAFAEGIAFAVIRFLKYPYMVNADMLLLADVHNEYQGGNSSFYFINYGFKYGAIFIAGALVYLLFRNYALPFLLNKSLRSPRQELMLQHVRVFLFVWVPLIVFTFFVHRNAQRFMLFVGFVAMPLALLHHAFIYFWLGPTADEKRWKLQQQAVILGVASFAVTFFSVSLFLMEVHPTSYGLSEIFWSVWGVLLILVSPASWFLYRQTRNQFQQVVKLETALSSSSANLDFLRSQINPHFLFNALNTLYGMAMQEHSDRTASGIQKLGDMMRFMLRENYQDAIPLSKEIQYLRDYIELQQLRTQSSDKIRIDTHLEEGDCNHEVAPMLLIPFVENAFKHGISLRRPSWIKVTLTCTPKQLFFDVYNSIHPATEVDPEKENSGVGLENVQQRLALLYKDRHELTIHQSATEYFIHLTLQFSHGDK